MTRVEAIIIMQGHQSSTQHKKAIQAITMKAKAKGGKGKGKRNA